MERLEAIAAAPFAPHANVRALKGEQDAFRLRQGDWRVVYRLDRTAAVDQRGKSSYVAHVPDFPDCPQTVANTHSAALEQAGIELQRHIVALYNTGTPIPANHAAAIIPGGG